MLATPAAPEQRLLCLELWLPIGSELSIKKSLLSITTLWMAAYAIRIEIIFGGLRSYE